MRVEHEIHGRRRGRNFGLLAVLVGFIAVVFGITVVKIQTGGLEEAFDHVARPAIAVPDESGAEAEAIR
jgi:hypothetical protein